MQPNDKPPFSRYRLLVLGLLLAALAGGLIVHTWGSDDVFHTRLLGVGLIGMMLGLAWLERRYDMQCKRQVMRALAAHLGLHCEEYGLFMGSAVQVRGTYRGRTLHCYHPRFGKGQVAATRLELHVANTRGAVLRLRGPFGRKAAAYDSVTREMFATTAAREFGYEQRFFVHSQPVHIATRLVATHAVWADLQALDGLASIELCEHTLSFEQLGVLTDAAAVQARCDVISAVADIIEEIAQAEHAYAAGSAADSVQHSTITVRSSKSG